MDKILVPDTTNRAGSCLVAICAARVYTPNVLEIAHRHDGVVAIIASSCFSDFPTTFEAVQRALRDVDTLSPLSFFYCFYFLAPLSEIPRRLREIDQARICINSSFGIQNQPIQDVTC
jgi:hypothetical protein